MTNNRIVLLTNGSLLVAGVQRLLEGVDDLKLFTVAAGDTQAIAEVRRLVPGVIIIDTGEVPPGDGCITRMLQEVPKARVIALNLGLTAAIEVYQLKQVVASDLGGLVDAIQGGAPALKKKSQPGLAKPRTGNWEVS